jgi:uncharacterized membrane protein
MKKHQLAYAAYMIFLISLIGAVFITPLLAFSSDMGGAYGAFSLTCHQKISRSLCLFSDGNGYWVADCVPQGGIYVDSYQDRTQIKVESGSSIGYKMPVCARDIGLYCAMLLGGIIYPFVKRLDERRVYPAIWLVLAVVPLGLDGGIQLLSEIGLLPFIYESTNMMRLLTGGIAGLVAAFYAIPILVNLLSSDEPIIPAKKKAKKG